MSLSGGFGLVAGGKGALELAGVLKMFAVCDCEAVGPVKLLACTEVDVSMLVRVQHCIKTGLRRHIDRSRRKSGIFVGIVR